MGEIPAGSFEKAEDGRGTHEGNPEMTPRVVMQTAAAWGAVQAVAFCVTGADAPSPVITADSRAGRSDRLVSIV